MPIEQVDHPRGFVFAVVAYLLWGFLPIYMKAVSQFPAAEVVAHRVIWSVPVAMILLIVLRRTSDLKTALRSKRILGMALITASLISVNWLTYVYAIATDRTLEAALGYYINPLCSVFLGFALLGEKLTQRQWVAIFITVLAVGVLSYEVGTLPWLSLILPITWAFYALFKRSFPIGPNQGFLLEVLILSPIALGYLIYLSLIGKNHFFAFDWTSTVLLVGLGAVTAIPLIVYANGAKLLKLSTIAMLQYIAPTLIFLVAVFLFGEEFGWAKRVAFPMIWVALLIFTSSSGKMHEPRD